MRTNALSRTFESTFQKEGIPCRVLKGHKFFERLEVKDLLAYLQLVDNPAYDPAFRRAVNTPSRGIGEKTIAQIVTRAQARKSSPYTIVQLICASKIPDVKPPVKKKLVGFVKVVEQLGAHAKEGMAAADLTRKLTELLDYHHHLRSTQPDWEARWENVQELITFASEFESKSAADEEEAGEDRDDEWEEADGTTPLRAFLQASMLSSDGDNDDSEGSATEKVTLSTCHAAKGLEWPVVFVPAVEEKMFPLDRSEDIEEERRLLYVACTRAQALLYLTHTDKRKIAAETMDRKLSVFVSKVLEQTQSIFSTSLPPFELGSSSHKREEICRIIGRKETDPREARRMMDEHNFQRAARRQQVPLARSSGARPWVNQQAPPACTGFGSSRVLHQGEVANMPGVPNGFVSSSSSTRSMAMPSGYFSSSRVLQSNAVACSSNSVASNSNVGKRQATPVLRATSAKPPSGRAETQPESSKKSSQSTLSLASWRLPKGTGELAVPQRDKSTLSIAPASTKEVPRVRQVSPSRTVEATLPPHAGSAANPISLDSPPRSRPPLKSQVQETMTAATVTQDLTVPTKRRLGMGGRTTGYVNKKFKGVQKST